MGALVVLLMPVIYFPVLSSLSQTTCLEHEFEKENIAQPAWKSPLISRQQMTAVFHSDLVSVSCWIHQSEARLFSTVQLSQAFWKWLSLALLKVDSEQATIQQTIWFPQAVPLPHLSNNIAAPHFCLMKSLVLRWTFIVTDTFIVLWLAIKYKADLKKVGTLCKT